MGPWSGEEWGSLQGNSAFEDDREDDGGMWVIKSCLTKLQQQSSLEYYGEDEEEGGDHGRYGDCDEYREEDDQELGGWFSMAAWDWGTTIQ